jgi:homospermidine synthase
VVEPDEMDYRRVLDITDPYWAPLIGTFTDWTPLTDRPTLFPDDVDPTDPWQFKNFRVL